jgi:hypothetical protein
MLPGRHAAIFWLASATPTSGRSGTGGQHLTEVSQAPLESFDEVRLDGWLSLGVAARWLGPRFPWLVDAERSVQQAVRVGRARVLRDEQEHAPVRCLEDGQQTPSAVQVQPADSRKVLSGEPDTRSRATAAAYVMDR